MPSSSSGFAGGSLPSFAGHSMFLFCPFLLSIQHPSLSFFHPGFYSLSLIPSNHFQSGRLGPGVLMSSGFCRARVSPPRNSRGGQSHASLYVLRALVSPIIQLGVFKFFGVILLAGHVKRPPSTLPCLEDLLVLAYPPSCWGEEITFYLDARRMGLNEDTPVFLHIAWRYVCGRHKMGPQLFHRTGYWLFYLSVRGTPWLAWLTPGLGCLLSPPMFLSFLFLFLLLYCGQGLAFLQRVATLSLYWSGGESAR